MKKTIYIILFITTLFSCKKQTPEPEAMPNTNNDGIFVTNHQLVANAMQIQAPTQQLFNQSIKTSGKIDVPPQNRAKVTTFVGGYIKSTNLLVGDKVTKGQALVTLESPEIVDIQKEYLEIAEQINYLKSEYNRQKSLFTENITSEKNYLKAQSDYKKALATYTGLKTKLNMLHINPSRVAQGKFTSVITITSPITGDIVIMNANVGMYVAPSDVILEIIQTNHLHLELSVFEKDILKVKEGQKIQFTVPQASTQIFDATVHLIGKSIEGNNKTINVHGHLDNTIKQQLLTGMFVEASIITNSIQGLAVPTEALITQDNKNYLLLATKTAQGYQFTKVPVTIGEKNEQYVQIQPNGSINNQTLLLTKGVFDLIN